ncbi:MAG: hypothetical protein M3124_08600 [Actinomycetota bacterium]|nr:hypothetical protein [Actinomycetota bacterium]
MSHKAVDNGVDLARRAKNIPRAFREALARSGYESAVPGAAARVRRSLLW